MKNILLHWAVGLQFILWLCILDHWQEKRLTFEWHFTYQDETLCTPYASPRNRKKPKMNVVNILTNCIWP